MNSSRCKLCVMLGILASIVACDRSEHAGDKASPSGSEHEGHHAHMDMPVSQAVQGHSLYQLDAPWTDQHGKALRWDDFSGRIVVLAMVYTHCDNACPRIIADMRRIRAALPDGIENIRFVLASIDPERDTIEHLQQFAKETGLGKQGWHLLRADHSTVRELAAVLGVQYRRISDADYAHSNVITVLAQDGVILHQQVGLGAKPDVTIAKINNAISSR